MIKIILQRARPVKPGYPVLGKMTRPTENFPVVYTLEDPLVLRPDDVDNMWINDKCIINKKIPGLTAIPAGEYRLYLTHSPTFKRMLPLVTGVPQFEGIRIHRGNTQEHSEGCIIVGLETDSKRTVGRSAEAEEAIINWMQAHQDEPIYLEVRNW